MPGKYENLLVQSNKLQKNTNQKSIKTRQTYFEKYNKFLKFVSENFNTSNIKNIESKHIYSYVEYMKEKELNNGYIKSTLSAIRFCHSLTDSKNRLVDNEKITEKLNKDLTRVSRGANRSWTKSETVKALEICDKHNRNDVKLTIKLSQSFGLRLNEVVTLRPDQVKKAIENNRLTIKGKGGKVRDIKIKTNEQRELLKYALNNKLRNDYILVKENQNVTDAKKSIQNFIYRQRDNFQNQDRISSREAYLKINEIRENHDKVKNFHGVLTSLSPHGCRHTYAKEEYFKAIQKEGYESSEAKKEVSKELGHGREEVTDIYLK